MWIFVCEVAGAPRVVQGTTVLQKHLPYFPYKFL